MNTITLLKYLPVEIMCFFFHWPYTVYFMKNLLSSFRFIRVGGYRLLNSWLTYSKTTNNTPLLQLILLTLQKLPLKVDHLKQVLSLVYDLEYNSSMSYKQRYHLTCCLCFYLLPEQHSQAGEAAEQECRYWRSVCLYIRNLNSFGGTVACIQLIFLSFICRSEKVSVRAGRWLDGYDPIPECLEQWQLSCRYR